MKKTKREKTKLCVICQKEPVFSGWVGRKDEFDKCQGCARKLADELCKEFIASLGPEQLIAFEKYQKAEQECVSMAILVD